MNTITGTEAIRQMREMKHDKNTHFVMHHLTFNTSTQESKGLRVVDRCRLRIALPNEKFKRLSDIYLPYTDLDLSEEDNARGAFKKTIRYVAFPPAYELLKVIWYE